MGQEIKKLAAIIGAAGAVVTSLAGAANYIGNYLDDFQTKKDAILLNLDNMIHSDELHLAAFESAVERGTKLTITEERTYKGLVTSIARMRDKQQEILGL